MNQPHRSGPRARPDPFDRPIASALEHDDLHLGVIDESYQRCATIGLSRTQAPDYSPLGRPDLHETLERNRRLYGHAAPVMDMLYEQIVNTQSMVVLTDACGTILHSIGDDDFLAKASKVALQPGVNWSESAKGTNAIGTALVSELSTLVHADEHFMHANHFLTCSAAPILDPRGNMLGVLDVTGDHKRYHQHTMGLVRMSARMIENHWLTEDASNVMRLHLHTRAQCIGTLMEGILAVTREGRVVGANRVALDLFGMSGAALRMHTVTSLFGTSTGALVDHFRSPMAAPLEVPLPNGVRCHLLARFSWSAWFGFPQGGLPERSEPAAAEAASDAATALQGAPAAPDKPPAGRLTGTASRHAAPASALATLDTGDARMAAVVARARKVLDHDIPVLLLGETGTGKELLARAMHRDSRRGTHAFVAVNCAAIPETLIESELFGHEEGAFTGARRRGAPGKLQQAHGGTLFLDEIGDMPGAMQARLLRVLQERQVTPLGSNKAVPIDIAVIAATHRDLRGMIERGEFREDLYYRLNSFILRLPPLRERSDLGVLAQAIVASSAKVDGRPPRIAPAVMHRLGGYHWPGNVRQLSNVLRTAALMASGETQITLEHLPEEFIADTDAHAGLRASVGAVSRPVAPTSATPAWPDGYGTASSSPASVQREPVREVPTEPAPLEARTLEEAEVLMIRAAMQAAGGNISAASKKLGISRNTIYRKLYWKSSR